MKKKLIMLIAALIIVSNMLFANTASSQVPESVVINFSKDFTSAKEVHWDVYGTYYKATFEDNGSLRYVFYSDNGEFMGDGKNVLSFQLPGVLKTAITSNYPGYWITELVKYNVGDRTGFLLTIENADQKIVLNSMDCQTWHLHTQENK